jgi:hypothetical protein
MKNVVPGLEKEMFRAIAPADLTERGTVIRLITQAED